MKPYYRYLLIAIIFAIIALVACDNVVGPSELICNPYPEDGARVVPLNALLYWDQPEICKRTEIYFSAVGEDWQPVEVAQPGYYDPGILKANTEYRWKVVTYGEDMEGPEWTFTTGNNSEGTGNLLWRFKAGDSIHSDPIAINGRVYFGSNDEFVYCLAASDGSELWRYKGDEPNDGGIVLDGDRVYFCGGWRELYCLDAGNGTDIWVISPYGCMGGLTPIVSDNRVYIGTSAHGSGYPDFFVCVNAGNGNYVWDKIIPASLTSSPFLLDDKFYYGSRDDKVYCISAIDGDFIWDADYRVLNRPYAIGDDLYIAFADRIYCLSTETGQEKWSCQFGDLIWAEMFYDNGLIYAGCEDGYMYCLDTATHSIVWKAQTGGAIRSGCAINDGKLYFGSDDNHFYCLDAADGTLLWKYRTGDLINCKPFYYEGTIFFGSRDGYFYCVDASN